MVSRPTRARTRHATGSGEQNAAGCRCQTPPVQGRPPTAPQSQRAAGPRSAWAARQHLALTRHDQAVAVELPVHPDALGVVAVDVVAVADIVGLEFHAASVAKTMADTSSGEGRGFASHVNLRVLRRSLTLFGKPQEPPLKPLVVQQARQRQLRHPWPGAGQGAPDGGRGSEDHQAEHRQRRRFRPDAAGRDRAGHDPQPAGRRRLHRQQGHSSRRARRSCTTRSSRASRRVTWTMSTWAMARPS